MLCNPKCDFNLMKVIFVCFRRKHEEIELFPLISACEVRLVAAPAVVHILPGGELVSYCFTLNFFEASGWPSG